jgi:RND family efflux transporter MFP subunit
MKSAVFLSWIGPILGALAFSVGCDKAAPADAPSAEPEPAADVRVSTRFEKVVQDELPPMLELTGTLDADERSEVAAQTSGVVTEVNIEPGARVEKGDVLVVLDTREAALRAASAAANADRERARLGLDGAGPFDPSQVPDVLAAQDALDLAERELERTRSLFESGAVAQAEYDRALSAVTRARAQLDVAKNGVRQAQASLRAAETQAGLNQKELADTRIVAPFSGAIVDKRVAPGEFAPLGRIVATLVNDNPLRLKVDVSETDLAGVKVGAPVEIHVDAFPDRRFQGTISRLGVALDAASRTLPIEADVPNDEGTLRPGFFATARIVLEGKPSPALLVPSVAVNRSGSSASVFVRDGDRVLERLVVVGRKVGDRVEISGPVKASDEVAVERVAELKDSAPVNASN